MTGQEESPSNDVYSAALDALDAPAPKMNVGFKLDADLAYEFKRYCKKAQLTHAHVARIALEEYLAARGITVIRGGTQT